MTLHQATSLVCTLEWSTQVSNIFCIQETEINQHDRHPQLSQFPRVLKAIGYLILGVSQWTNRVMQVT